MIRKQSAIIAIVDDSAAVRSALTRLLSVLGYHTECYASAREFGSAAATSDAMCVLVDIPPGNMSGLEMVRDLSASGFKCPVIFMTGSGSDLIRARAEALGCSDYLIKPISINQLIESLERVTGMTSRIG
jgi:FixJ family two-component response regulator